MLECQEKLGERPLTDPWEGGQGKSSPAASHHLDLEQQLRRGTAHPALGLPLQFKRLSLLVSIVPAMT